MSVDQYLADLEHYAHAVDEVHSVGGLHPDWDISHYEGLFSATKERFPHIAIKALTAVEIKHLAQLSSISTKDVLRRLQAAGLTSLPGVGRKSWTMMFVRRSATGRRVQKSIYKFTAKPTNLVSRPTAPCSLERSSVLSNGSNT